MAKADLIDYSYTPFSFNPVMFQHLCVRDGQFVLPGCNPVTPRRVFFLDADHQWGAAVDIDADKAHGNLPKIHLMPCGSAVARFLDRDKNPFANWHPLLSGADLVLVAKQLDRAKDAAPEYPHLDVEYSMENLDQSALPQVVYQCSRLRDFPNAYSRGTLQALCCNSQGWSGGKGSLCRRTKPDCCAGDHNRRSQTARLSWPAGMSTAATTNVDSSATTTVGLRLPRREGREDCLPHRRMDSRQNPVAEGSRKAKYPLNYLRVSRN